MTIRVDIAHASLSELVAQAEAGEEVVLTRGGKPVATLTAAAPSVGLGPRQAGAWAHLGKLQDPDIFLGTDPELEDAADGPVFPPE